MSDHIDFGHSDKGMSQDVIDLMVKGTVEVKGVVYIIKSVDIVDQFTDPSLIPTFNVSVEISNHTMMDKGNYLATGTLRQCFEYILAL